MDKETSEHIVLVLYSLFPPPHSKLCSGCGKLMIKPPSMAPSGVQWQIKRACSRSCARNRARKSIDSNYHVARNTKVIETEMVPE